jgi:hypothetical protein
MCHQPENRRYLKFDFADIIQLFDEFEKDYWSASDKESSENIAVKDRRETERYDDEKSQIDKNPLDGRHGFPGVFEVVSRFIQNLEFAKNPQTTYRDECCYDDGIDELHISC